MKIQVVVLQHESNYYFSFEGERVPLVHEFVVDRNNKYHVESVMTYRKDNRAIPVLVVRRVETDKDMERIMSDLESRV